MDPHALKIKIEKWGEWEKRDYFEQLVNYSPKAKSTPPTHLPSN